MSKILFADDDSISRLVGVPTLEGKGYTVIVAVDGTDAVAKFNEHKDAALIILDLEMPGIFGPEAMAEIRKQGYKGPSILASSHTLSSTEEAATLFNAGLKKPYRPAELLKVVESLIGPAVGTGTGAATETDVPAAKKPAQNPPGSFTDRAGGEGATRD